MSQSVHTPHTTLTIWFYIYYTLLKNVDSLYKMNYRVSETCCETWKKWEKLETINRPPSGVKKYWEVSEKLSQVPSLEASSASTAPDIDQEGNLHLIGSLSSPIMAVGKIKK